jgi:hypothetical protein
MAISLTNAMPTSFKVELFKGLHDFSNGADTFKIALFKSASAGAGTYGAATTNYSDMTGNSDEVPNGSGYTTGGEDLTNVTPTSDSTTAICDFDNVTWTGATFTSCGALIYNTNNSNSACAVLTFGGDQQVTSGDFQVQFPSAAAATAIIRIA